MRLLRRLSIKNKLIAILMLTTSSIALIGLAAMAYINIKSFKQDLVNSCEINAILAADYSITPIAFEDRTGAEEIILTLQKVPYIVNVYIYDENGNIFATYMTNPNFGSTDLLDEYDRKPMSRFVDNHLHVVQPIYYQDVYYGTVYLLASTDLLSARIREHLILTGALVCCLLGIAYLLAMRLQAVISRPILDLATVTNEVSRSDDYTVRVINNGTDEIAALYSSFNNMLEQIQIRKEERDKAEEATKRLARILESTTDLVLMGNPRRGVAFANVAARKALGWSDSVDLDSMTLADIHPECQLRRITEESIRIAMDVGIWEGESEIKSADGRTIPVSQVIIGHKSETGKVENISTIMRDISERIEAEKELKLIAERLKTSQEAGQIGTFIVDVPRETWTGTEYMYRLFGIQDSGELTFDSWVATIHPDYREEMKTYMLHDVLGSGIPYDKEYKIIRPNDGAERWIHGLGQVEFDENGRPLKLVGAARDITANKQAEEDARNARNYIRSIINSMPSILIGLDNDGLVTHWNHQAEQLTGVSSSRAEGRAIQIVFPQFFDEMPSVERALHDLEIVKDEKKTFEFNGETRITDVTIYPLISEGMDGAVIRIDDVTDRERIEEMIIQSEKMMSVGGLAAGMAHEINNPLAGILQNVRVIQNRFSDTLAKNAEIATQCGTSISAIIEYINARGIAVMMESVIDSGIRAARIVENMLSFSRKSTAEVSTHNIVELLDKTVELASNDYNLKKQYDFRKLNLIREYADDDIRLACEAGKIQQVLLNILKNGAQAMADKEYADGVEPQMVLRVYIDGSDVVIQIEDNGPGMDEATRKRVFEPFFTTKSVGVGTGLGLSVSYFIITDNHGGQMSVDAVPGEGTTFTIRLPREQSDVQKVMA
ncbi:MAG: PAS domain S-box protein [Candidatus Zixiibacteriota bacterium]